MKLSIEQVKEKVKEIEISELLNIQIFSADLLKPLLFEFSGLIDNIGNLIFPLIISSYFNNETAKIRLFAIFQV